MPVASHLTTHARSADLWDYLLFVSYKQFRTSWTWQQRAGFQAWIFSNLLKDSSSDRFSPMKKGLSLCQMRAASCKLQAGFEQKQQFLMVGDSEEAQVPEPQVQMCIPGSANWWSTVPMLVLQMDQGSPGCAGSAWPGLEFVQWHLIKVFFGKPCHYYLCASTVPWPLFH